MIANKFLQLALRPDESSGYIEGLSRTNSGRIAPSMRFFCACRMGTITPFFWRDDSRKIQYPFAGNIWRLASVWPESESRHPTNGWQSLEQTGGIPCHKMYFISPLTTLTKTAFVTHVPQFIANTSCLITRLKSTLMRFSNTCLMPTLRVLLSGIWPQSHVRHGGYSYE
jgi:hypothetical protein